jgi:hypothetical protein
MNDQVILDDLKSFLSEREHLDIIRTELALIIPEGASGYATDDDGRVVGIKIGRFGGSREVIETVMQFKRLRRLVLYPGDPVEIPAMIGELRDLRFLWLGGNIKRLPQEILRLDLPIYVSSEDPNLDERADFQSRRSFRALRKVKDLFKTVARPKVEPIDSSEKQRTEVADTQEDWKKRGRMEDEEVLTVAPDDGVRKELFKLSNDLSGIFLERIELEDPPLEIAVKGSHAIEKYFQDQHSGTLPLNEVKVLLVGNGSSGKTSLVKRLLGDAFNPAEPQTHGINIRSWTLHTRGSRGDSSQFLGLWWPRDHACDASVFSVKA